MTEDVEALDGVRMYNLYCHQHGMDSCPCTVYSVRTCRISLAVRLVSQDTATCD